jgi:hypothetical protein
MFLGIFHSLDQFQTFRAYTKTLKITLFENNSTWEYFLFKKKLKIQNQTLVTTICLCVNAIAPTMVAKV